MVIALIRPAIAAGKFVYKNRQAIYRVLSAQDRYIDKSMKAGHFGKASRYGVRHGALIGSLVGSLIAPPTPGNDDGPVQQGKRPQTSTPYKTRSGRTTGSFARSSKEQRSYHCKRCARTRKF